LRCRATTPSAPGSCSRARGFECSDVTPSTAREIESGDAGEEVAAAELPCSATSRSTVPESGAVTSTLTFSIWISAMVSPASTVAPSRTNQFETTASSTSIASAGHTSAESTSVIP